MRAICKTSSGNSFYYALCWLLQLYDCRQTLRSKTELGSEPSILISSRWEFGMSMLLHRTGPYSMVTLITTGYGDLLAETPRKMLFYILYMLFNHGLTSYLIGNITNLVLHRSCCPANFRDNVAAATEFARRNQLPPDIQDQIQSHMCLKFKTERFKHSRGYLRQFVAGSRIFYSIPFFNKSIFSMGQHKTFFTRWLHKWRRSGTLQEKM